MSTFLLFLSLVGCEDSGKGFSSLGQTSLDPDQVMPQGGSGNADTGDSSQEDNPNAPRVSDAIAFFSEVTGVGDVIEVHIVYVDEQNDIMGGAISVDYYSSVVNESMVVNVDGTDAIVEEGEITFIFQDVDSDETYSFDMVLTDASGNQSDLFYATAVPVQ